MCCRRPWRKANDDPTHTILDPPGSEEGCSVWIPGLPGCCSQGKTEAEAIANIKIAAQEYLSAVEELTEGGEVREIEVAV